jgi:transcriptional regulator with XRE-family HTH domain
MTQAELAAKMGVTEHCLSRWESGARNPKYENLCRIANALCVDVDKLLPVRRWISVDEGLPEEGKQVLVCTRRGTVFTSHYDHGRWHVAYSVTITHWMPLPPPAIEEEM